jgi:hypothetical protein
METQLDHTYLRPGIISRAAAVGLAAIGLGLGVLLACWGASFFWHIDDAVVRRLDAIGKQTAGLSDALRDQLRALSLKTTESLDALGRKIDALGSKIDALGEKIDVLGNRVDVIDQRVLVSKPFLGGGQPEKTPDGDIIRREVTVFNTVSHADGVVTTGWVYKDGASGGRPMSQFCYYTSGKDGAWLKIDLGSNGQRLFNENVTKVPQLEEAIAKCQWWTS